MGDKSLVVAHRCLLQIVVAAQATRIVRIGLTMFPLGFPVNSLSVMEILYIEIVQSLLRLADEIGRRATMIEMAVCAIDLDAIGVIAAVDIRLIGMPKLLHGVATHAEINIGRTVQSLIGEHP